jgi:hypothetical protein
VPGAMLTRASDTNGWGQHRIGAAYNYQQD